MPSAPPVPYRFFGTPKPRGTVAILLREGGGLPLEDGGGALPPNAVPIARTKKAELFRRRLKGDGAFWSDWGRVRERLHPLLKARLKGGARGSVSLLKTPNGSLPPNLQRALDAFASKWRILGMSLGKQDEPVIQDLTAQVTPTETLIRIPSYWSFDNFRDVNWQMVTRLHKARGVVRQGEKLDHNQTERRLQIVRLTEAAKMARALDLHGEARMIYMKRHARLFRDTDDAHVRRLLRDGRELNGSVR